jgi:pSer/pThr/pTyr-binding forkhead associated (FHA) protein/tetratricopeptide (TPR) repeat protein
LKLHIQDDAGRTTIVPVLRESISIGRAEGNAIRLAEQNVSRQHARLVRAEGVLYLEEVRARYGTRVNGDKIDGRMPIGPGDVIQIGDFILAVHIADSTMVDEPTQDFPLGERMDTPIGLRTSTLVDDMGQTSPTLDIPTTTVKMMPEDEASRPIPLKERARLVALSSNLGGLDHALRVTPTVIGRTDDNELQLDHPSISKHHAVIQWDQGVYTVRDLESANGIKVNGEFYGRADLHPGDEIEMGHVKVRFVAPGEAFVVGGSTARAETTIMTLPEVKSTRLTKWAIGATVLMIIAVFWVWRHYSERPIPNVIDETNATQIADSNETHSSQSKRPPTSHKTQPTSTSKKPPINATRVVVKTPPDKPPVVETPPDKPPVVETPPDKPPVVETPPDKPPVVETPPDKPPVVETPPDKPPVVDTPPDKPPVVETPPDKPPVVETLPGVDVGEKVATLVAEARSSWAKGQFDAANKAVRAALKLAPKHAEGKKLLRRITADKTATAALDRARASKTRKRWAKAWKQANGGLAVRPNAGIANALRRLKEDIRKPLAVATIRQGKKIASRKKFKQAKNLFKKALRFDRNNESAKRLLTLMNNKLKVEEAKKAAKAEKKKKAAEAYQKARTAQIAGNGSLARKYYRECYRLNRANQVCQHKVVESLTAGNKAGRCRAVKLMRRYLAKNPGGKHAYTYKSYIDRYKAQCETK